jgi:hypothetical protein
VRAKASLRDAEAENLRAGQLEQDETFAKTLKELMGHAAKLAECHKRLRELHLSAGCRYPSELFWPTFDSQGHYARWLSDAAVFISRLQEQKDEHTNGPSSNATVDGQGAADRQSQSVKADARQAEGSLIARVA